VVAPPGALVYWYNKRVAEMNEARKLDGRSWRDTIRSPTALEKRVRWEGVMVFGVAIAYWLLLSIVW